MVGMGSPEPTMMLQDATGHDSARRSGMMLAASGSLHAGATSQESGALVQELYQDARTARQQLDAKRADLVTAMQALQQTEQALREVLHDRQSKHGEIRLLRQKVASLEANSEESQKRLAETEEQKHSWEQRCEACERRHRAAETRCDELEARLRAAEEFRVEADRRSELVEQATMESARCLYETERQCQLRAEHQVLEAKQMFEEAGVQRQKEIKAALAELQALSQGQVTLRTELRRAMRPPPVPAYVAPPMPEVPTTPPGRTAQMAMDEALERTRARVSVARGVQPDLLQSLPPYSGSSGSLLTGRVRAQAELVLSQAGRTKVNSY